MKTYLGLVERDVLVVIADREMQSYSIIAAIHCGLPGWTFRQVDAAIQKLRRKGLIELLPRIKGTRPYPLWRKARTGTLAVASDGSWECTVDGPTNALSYKP